MIPMGQIEKMRIQAYTDATGTTAVGEAYTFQVNPASYNYKYQLEQVEEKAPGSSGSPLKYYRQLPNEWEFEILIDGTGVVKNASALDISLIGKSQTLKVEDEVEKLKSIVLDYHGDIHRNQYLKISWGERQFFKGTLVSLDLNYKLFKPDGSPLRVIAKLRLKEWVDPEQRIREEDASSPDITHQRTYSESDRFDLMVNKIYNTPDYYLDVAKANNLDSFRKIRVGRKINFPPLK